MRQNRALQRTVLRDVGENLRSVLGELIVSQLALGLVGGGLEYRVRHIVPFLCVRIVLGERTDDHVHGVLLDVRQSVEDLTNGGTLSVGVLDGLLLLRRGLGLLDVFKGIECDATVDDDGVLVVGET